MDSQNTPVSSVHYPRKLQVGDKVAVLSPSSGLPELFPAIFEEGLQRLRGIFQLVPVEYPTTRKMHSSLEERARDVHAAFADPTIKAILCSIGGSDQIKLLRYLDIELLKMHPKEPHGNKMMVHQPKVRPYFGSRVGHLVKVRTPASRLKRLFPPLETLRRF